MAHMLEDKPRTKDIHVKEEYTFNSLFLPDKILQGLRESGFLRPSPIQLKAIPLGRCGLDLIVKAKSGTGKTVVFTVLALETIDLTISSPQVIIVAPTREIAVQIEGVTAMLGKKFDGLQVACFIGGLPIEDDIRKLKNCHIAIGAPGRLKALVEKKHLKTKSVRLFVLDEADKLLEHSFQADINYIYNSLPPRKQVLAVSATYLDDLDKFLTVYMNSPTFVTPDLDSPLLLGLKQFVSVVTEHKNIMQQIEIKTNELVRLLSQISFTQCIVFFNFQTRAETLRYMLKKHGWNALYISGSQPQKERLKVIKSLKKFQCRVLLTTDLTARGIDASNINLVINYEVPFKADSYLHRMGRAGRYGSHGLCITIASEGQELCELQKILGQIGGSEFCVPKVPETLGDLWTCSSNDLEKIEGIVDNDSTWNIEKSLVDIKVVNENLKELKMSDEIADVGKSGSCVQSESGTETNECMVEKCTDEESITKEAIDGEFISAHILYPWTPITDSVLSKPTGNNLLDDDLSSSIPESIKKRKVSEDDDPSEAKLILSKNIALYNTAKLLSLNDLELSEDLSSSVGNYFNLLQEEEKKREQEMEKFFEPYSCDDILKNLAEHTETWSNAKDVNNKSASVVAPSSNVTGKENIFEVGYDYIMKKDSKNWSEVVSDYCSTEDENEDEFVASDNSSYTEAKGNLEYNDSAMEVQSCNWTEDSLNHNDYGDIPMFNNLYDQCSQDMYNYGGTFTDEESANAWYDNWRTKVSSVTNYVQQNIETYEKSLYQYYHGNS